jgi:hypothetical protein
MTKESSTDWELTIDLPLGVVASQLTRIEEQLRQLNDRARDLLQARDGGRRNGEISVRLENINKALDSIGAFIAGLEAEIEATRRSSEAVVAQTLSRKSYPDWDD